MESNSPSQVEKVAARVPLEFPIEFKRNYARQKDAGVLRNISLTGAFLESQDLEHLLPEDKIVVTFAVTGRRRRIHASIIWKNQLGCGIRFHPSNNRDVQIVDDLIYFVQDKRSSQKTVLEDIFKWVA